jgi:hypothetical protein
MYLYLLIAPFAIAIILWRSIYIQTMRADRAEAALAKIEATIAECQRAAEAEMNAKPSAAAIILADLRARGAAKDAGQ